MKLSKKFMRASKGGNKMIQIQGATKTFGDFKALDHIDIHIKKGTIYGIIGENGAGKTTLIKSLVGIYTLDEGSITIEGLPIYENNKVKQKIGYVADQNQYFKGYRLKHLVSFFKETYPSFSEEKFHAYNEKMKLDLNKKVYQLSKGMQMRLALILNLAIEPEVLVLDEPTSGLDAVVKKEVLDLIIEEVEARQMTVLISSHHLAELERICDEMSMISHGKITYQSSVDELKERIRKVQVAFEGEFPKELEEDEEILDITHIGSVYYIVTKDYSEAFEARIRHYGVKLLEPIPLSLEEIFIYTNKA